MRKIFFFLKNLFRSLKGLAEKFVKPSVEIVEGIKKAVDNPLVDILTVIIPGNLDDRIIQKTREVLPKVLKILRISDECLKLQAVDEIIICVVKKLKTYDAEGRAASYHSIAALLSVYLSDKKISWREAVHISEEIFQQRKKLDNEANG